jgi:putative oxidoreductase
LVRRLFSTYADGLPGAGLLVMRLVTGIALGHRAIAVPRGELSIETAMWFVLAALAGILLLAGLWTPIGGTLVVVVELGRALWQPGDPWIHILSATLGAALALLGPGTWSVDARLFGWKRIDIRERRSDARKP